MSVLAADSRGRASSASVRWGARKGRLARPRAGGVSRASGAWGAGVVRVTLLPDGPQAIARGLQLGVLPSAGDALDRVLRDHGQGQRLGHGERLRRLAEVDEAGRLDAFDVGAIGRGVEVGLQDLGLAVAQLQPHGQADLRELARHVARVQAMQAPGELHAQRRAALPAPTGEGGPRTAHQRRRVDAGVPVEPAVFVQAHAVDQHGRHAGQRHPQAVLLIGGQRQAQELAALRAHGHRAAEALAQRLMRCQAQGDKAGGHDSHRLQAFAPCRLHSITSPAL